MGVMRRRLTTLWAVALLGLTAAGCSDDEGGEAPLPEESPTALSELDVDPEAAAAVSQGLDALREGNTGTFTTHLDYAELAYDYHGSYRIAPAQHRMSVTAALAEGPVATDVVGHAGGYHVRLPSDGPVSSRCWVSGDPQRIAEATGLETNPDFERLPGALGLAATATGAAYAGGSGELLGSVDLATAAALISPRLPALLAVTAGQVRVLARLSLDAGVLTGIGVDGPAILAALEQSGTEADPAELAEVFGAATPIQVGLADSGAQVVIRPPAPAAVIALGAPDAQNRLAACG